MAAFIALGDSYTVGTSVDAALSWPSLLWSALTAQGIALGAEPLVIAKRGWTTVDLTAAMRERGLIADGGGDGAAFFPAQKPASLVMLSIGVNNQYDGLPLADFEAHFASLLDSAITLAGGDASRVLVVSIPDWSVTRFAADRDRGAIAASIDLFNGAKRAITMARGVRWLDITPLSRERRDGWEAEDGLHPSGAQYGAWVEDVLLPAAREAVLSREKA